MNAYTKYNSKTENGDDLARFINPVNEKWVDDLVRYGKNRYKAVQNQYIRHIEEWKGSGVSDDVIALNLRSHEFEEAANLLNRSSYRLEPSRAWSVPGHSVEGDKESITLKFDTPQFDYKKNKERKYEQRSGGKSGLIYIFPLKPQMVEMFRAHGIELTEEDIEHGYTWCLWKYPVNVSICEGVKKAAALVSNGVFAVAIQGVWCWKTVQESPNDHDYKLSPELALLACIGRNFTLIPDNDIKAKSIEDVGRAFSSLGLVLQDDHKCNVDVVIIKGDKKGIDDFIVEYGWDAFKSLKRLSLYQYRYYVKRIAAFTYPVALTVNEELLQPVDNALISLHKLIGIRSAKGTGKTKALLHYTAAVELVIIHRRSLGRNIHKGKILAGLKEYGYYLDEESKGKRQLIICIDSLWKLEPMQWVGAQIIIDEVEQVLDHMVRSSTLKNERNEVMNMFKLLIQHASRVIIQDADLSDVSIGYLSALMGENPFIIHNEHIGAGYPCYFHMAEKGNGHEKAMPHLLTHVRCGINTFLVSDSKDEAIAYHKQILEVFPDVKILAVHSDSTGQEDVAAFLADPDNEQLKYQVIIASPTLGTGVSLEKTHFEVVYGFFTGYSITHYDMSQMLSRVRATVPRYVSITNRLDSKNINVETIKKEELEKNKRTTESINATYDLAKKIISQGIANEKEMDKAERMVLKYEHSLSPIHGCYREVRTLDGYGIDEPELFDLYAELEARRNDSLNDVGNSLKCLLEAEGNQVTDMFPEEHHVIEAKEAGETHKACVKEVKQEKIDVVVNAHVITDEEATALEKRKDKLTPDEKASRSRYIIDKALGQVTPLVVELVQTKNLLQAANSFRNTQKDDEAIFVRDVDDCTKHQFFADRSHPTECRKLLLSLRINEVTNPEHVFSSRDNLTQEVSTLCIQHTKDIKLLLGFKVHKKSAPIRIIQALLEYVGLQLGDATRIRLANGEYEREYQIDAERWQLMQEIMEHKDSLYTPKDAEAEQKEMKEFIEIIKKVNSTASSSTATNADKWKEMIKADLLNTSLDVTNDPDLAELESVFG